MQITGTLKVKMETYIVNDKFQKREFVLTDNSSQYPQHISIQLTQDRCSLLDNIQRGQQITAHINLRGREWTSPLGEIKYFNTIECWKIDVVAEHNQDDDMSGNDYHTPITPLGKDDLPF